MRTSNHQHETHTAGHFTFWLRPWLSLLAETKH